MKANGKKIMALVAIVALVAILGVCLAACNSDNVGKKLEKKGYSVVTLNDDSTGLGKTVYNLVKSNSDFKEGVLATKGNDMVTVLWFETTDAAESLEGNLKGNILFSASTVERSGKVVYVGTEQGVKDAK